MAHFRLGLTLLFSLAGFFQIQAQNNPVLYAGFDYYRHTDFEEDSFGDLTVGVQLWHWKFFAPEIGVESYYGRIQDRNIFWISEVDGIGPVAKAFFNSSFTSTVLTLSPKLKIGKDEAFISFSPTYHTGNVTARGRYYLLNDAQNRYELSEFQKKTASVSYWSFSLGIEGIAVQTEKYWFTLFLNYTKLNTQKAFGRMEFSDNYVKVFDGNTNTIGFGVRFYYNPFPSEND
jgi:hypothetical protein